MAAQANSPVANSQISNVSTSTVAVPVPGERAVRRYHATPSPIIQFWYGSHPTPAERIDFFNTYRPWKTGQPSKYSDYMKP